MTREEMRFLRREIINVLIQANRWDFNLWGYNIKGLVRINETGKYGQELKVYA